MPRTFQVRMVVGGFVLLLGLSHTATAQSDSTKRDSEVVKRKRSEPFRWQTAGGNYMDPTSFFSLHGYVDAVYAGSSRDWTAPNPAGPGMPGQVLIPNTARSSFQYDAALFAGAELSERGRLMIEWHLVSDPGGRGAAGPGGNTIVMTEATVSWDLVPEYLTMSGGLYWAPFATVNKDWLGAQNLFTTIPEASAAFPAHFNERGVRFNGARTFTSQSAVNYVLSVGNGVENFDISGQTSYDTNAGKTTIGRVGVFPGLGKALEIGGSFAQGGLRDNATASRGTDDPLRYAADFSAVAVDAVLQRKALSLRSYLLRSTETFGNASRAAATPGSLARGGQMIEASATIASSSLPFGITRVVPKVRLDQSWADALNTGGAGKTRYRSSTFSFGTTVAPQERMVLSLEYHVRREGQRPALANNRFVARLTAEF